MFVAGGEKLTVAVTGHGTFRQYTGNKLGISRKKYPLL
jgi:hypothetical protein